MSLADHEARRNQLRELHSKHGREKALANRAVVNALKEDDPERAKEKGKVAEEAAEKMVRIESELAPLASQIRQLKRVEDINERTKVLKDQGIEELEAASQKLSVTIAQARHHRSSIAAELSRKRRAEQMKAKLSPAEKKELLQILKAEAIETEESVGIPGE